MMRNDLRRALDPVFFAQDGLNIVPDTWQLHALRYNGIRMLLNCSRQTGKTLVACILSLHRILYYPESLVLLVSPSLRQSGEGMRRIISLLQRLQVKPKLLEDNKLSLTLENGSRVICLPSREDTIRGFSANLIIEDESARVPDSVYLALRPTLSVSGGRLVLMSTPWGKRGHFYNEWTKGINWEHIEVKATDCPRISAQFLTEERRTMGDIWFNQEYFCIFSDNNEQLFDIDLVTQAITDEVEPLWR